jgi:hypothetical protein
VSFAAISLCVVCQRVFIVVVDFVIDSVRKLLDTPSYKRVRKLKRQKERKKERKKVSFKGGKKKIISLS